MAGYPERLKPRHIAVQGLRILLLHMADELVRIVARHRSEVKAHVKGPRRAGAMTCRSHRHVVHICRYFNKNLYIWRMCRWY